jgi:N-hydroxyarylamine O-acetyltransferase
MHTIDLDAYFHRIGYTGDTEPTLATLRALHLAHAMSFVFENLDSWTGRRVSLELEDLEDKIVRRRRGGYCFEANTLFAAVLRQLGYDVRERIGWVVWMQPPEARPARTHMLLQVTINGQRWTADVGFGAVGQTMPLALDTDEPQVTTHETRRFIRKNGIIHHQVQIGPEQWEDAYLFDERNPLPMDFEVANWFTNTHPDTIFRKTLVITRPRPDHRLTIAFGEFIKRNMDGSSEKRPIQDDEDLRRLLVQEFDLPADDPAVRAVSLKADPAYSPNAVQASR